MSELKSPVQPFIVRHKGALSAIQMQSLVQLYQPIIGMDAVNFYLLLFQQPVNEQKISTQKVHSSLFPYIAGSLGKIDDARLHLEAVGLIETYKQTGEGILYPTLLYDMQYPLLIKDFLDNPLLSNALINQLGDVEFFEVVRQWEVAPIEMAEYEEVTVSFETIMTPTHNDYQAQAYEAKNGYNLQHHDQKPPSISVVDDFDYMKVMRKLINSGIDHQVLGPRVKQETLAIHKVYGFDEEQISQLLLESYNGELPAIQYQELKLAAQRMSEKNKHQTTNVPPASSQPVKEIVEKTTIQTLKEQYPHFAEADLEIMALCEEVSPEVLLTQIKQSKNGFVSSNEIQYVHNIAMRSQLPKSVQTFLVYYLLMIENRADFQKGESERIANLWQQEQLTTVAKVMTFVHQKAKDRMMKQKQYENRQNHNKSYPSYQRQKKTERQPYWAQQNQESQKNQSDTQPTDTPAVEQPSEVDLRSQLGQIFERGRDE